MRRFSCKSLRPIHFCHGLFFLFPLWYQCFMHLFSQRIHSATTGNVLISCTSSSSGSGTLVDQWSGEWTSKDECKDVWSGACYSFLDREEFRPCKGRVLCECGLLWSPFRIWRSISWGSQWTLQSTRLSAWLFTEFSFLIQVECMDYADGHVFLGTAGG